MYALSSYLQYNIFLYIKVDFKNKMYYRGNLSSLQIKIKIIRSNTWYTIIYLSIIEHYGYPTGLWYYKSMNDIFKSANIKQVLHKILSFFFLSSPFFSNKLFINTMRNSNLFTIAL